MPGKFSNIELLFIEEVLDQHGEYLSDLFVDTIDSKNLKKSEDLINSIDYKTGKDIRGIKLSFTFEAHGRFIEINFFKRRTNSLLLGERQNSKKFKSKKKKDTQWYTRNVYGSLNRLAGILMFELSDHERERLKGILDQRVLRNS